MTAGLGYEIHIENRLCHASAASISLTQIIDPSVELFHVSCCNSLQVVVDVL